MGRMAHQQGDYAAACALLEESLALHRELGNHGGVVAGYAVLAVVARDRGDYGSARALYEQMLVTAPEAGEERGIYLAYSLYGRGYVAYLQGDLAAAQALLEEGMVIYRQHDRRYHIGWILTHLAEVADARGEYPTAEVLLAESLNTWHQLDAEDCVGFSLHRLGRVMLHRGDLEAARTQFRKALAILQQQEDRRGVAECLEGLAGLAAAQGRPARGARLLGAAAALREAIVAPLAPVERGEHDRHVAALRAQLDEATFAHAWAEGQAWPLERTVEEALTE
jgi:ATP/maltotriose-dependent transcriptional regulator MalT